MIASCRASKSSQTQCSKISRCPRFGCLEGWGGVTLRFPVICALTSSAHSGFGGGVGGVGGGRWEMRPDIHHGNASHVAISALCAEINVSHGCLRVLHSVSLCASSREWRIEGYCWFMWVPLKIADCNRETWWVSLSFHSTQSKRGYPQNTHTNTNTNTPHAHTYTRRVENTHLYGCTKTWHMNLCQHARPYQVACRIPADVLDALHRSSRGWKNRIRV